MNQNQIVVDFEAVEIIDHGILDLNQLEDGIMGLEKPSCTFP